MDVFVKYFKIVTFLADKSVTKNAIFYFGPIGAIWAL